MGVTVVVVIGAPGWDEVYFEHEGTVLATATNPASFSYTFPTDMSGELFFGVTGLAPGSFPVLDTTCTAAPANETPVRTTALVTEPVPGCDMGMKMTEYAAVGTFVVDTHVLWGPDANANTEIILPAGKTAWVLGVDETGAFYKFIWNCTYLWAPVNTLGPNFDAVWNGTPLPTGVVG